MSELKWWQTAVFYQIYPRSFADGNGNSIGDFAGIIEKLDYLADLGIDAIWLSPHFPSPNWDWGYDISDYSAVTPEYGTLEAFRTFLNGAHRRGIRVILNLVLNHTSDQRAWFLEIQSSRDNPKADWYIWYDTPPNNWQSFSTATRGRRAERNQVYYHYFMKQQPDLNWRNPAVKQASGTRPASGEAELDTLEHRETRLEESSAVQRANGLSSRCRPVERTPGGGGPGTGRVGIERRWRSWECPEDVSPLCGAAGQAHARRTGNRGISGQRESRPTAAALGQGRLRW